MHYKNFLILLVVLFIGLGCSKKILVPNPILVHTSSSSEVTLRDSLVLIPLPEVTLYNRTKDTISTLTSKLATSTAIYSKGVLYHDLISKDSVKVKTIIKTITKIDTVRITNVVEVERNFTKKENFYLVFGEITVKMLLAIISFVLLYFVYKFVKKRYL